MEAGWQLCARFRFPGVVRSKPHGQTVWELRTFGVPHNAFRARSPQRAGACSNLFHRASALRLGVAAEASSSFRTPQVAVACKSASRSVALHSGECVLLQRVTVVHAASFDAPLRHVPLSTSRYGQIASTSRALSSSSFEYLPRHALLSAIPSCSRAISTSLALHRQHSAAASTRRADSIRAQYLDECAGLKTSSNIVSESQPKLRPVIAVRVGEPIADGCGLSRSSAQSLHRRHPAGCRSRQACTGFRSDAASSAWSFDQRTGVLMQPRVFSRVKEQCRQALSPLYLEKVRSSS